MHNNYLFRFCPVCGGDFRTVALKENEPPRLVCSLCNFVFYLDPKLVACAIVEIKGKIVLVKRAMSPERGKWVIPGGYVDRGEEVETAAVRETKEECGIDIRLNKLLGVYSYPGYLEVVIVYLAEYESGDLIAGEENTASTLVSPGEIPWETLAFQSTRDALKEYCDLKKIQ